MQSYAVHDELYRKFRFAVWFILNMVMGSAVAFAQLQIVSPKEGEVSSLTRQAVVAKGWPSTNAELFVNGKLAKKDQIRIDGIVDFLNVEVEPGDVVFEVRMVNPDGSSIGSAKRTMHILSPPGYVEITLEKTSLRANGRSTTSGSIRVLDKWNVPIQNNVIVTVIAERGTITTPDLDSLRAGVQIQLINGIAPFEYRADKTTGIVTLSAQAEQATASVRLSLETPTEPFSMVGLLSGTIAQRQNHIDTSAELALNNSFERGLSTNGRASIYARGTIADDYLMIASYDSDRRNRSRLFRDLDPDYLYSIYGDNSMLYYDAQSNKNVFVKIEHNQSFLLFGDYNTNLTNQEFTAYNRSLNGVQVVHQSEGWKLTGFCSLTDRKAVQKELPGQGLSGFYTVGYTNITSGSEKIRIETRDKFHSEVIVRSIDLYRFNDYEIDYQQGTIFFKQPVPAIDASGNPNYIVVTFEATMDQATSYVAGGRIEHQFSDNFNIGFTAVTEEQEPTNYTLFGTNVAYQFGKTFGIQSEIARSKKIGSSGMAYKIEPTFSPWSNLTLKGYYRKVEQGFTNVTQLGSQRELGTLKYGVGGKYQPWNTTKASADFYQSEQMTLTGNTRLNSLSGSVEHELMKNLSSAVRIEDLRYDSPSSDTVRSGATANSTLGTVQLDYAVTPNFSLAVQHERNLGSDKDVTRPNGTSLLSVYRIIDDVRLQGQIKSYEDGGYLSSVGITSTPLVGTDIYGKYEISNAASGYRNTISIGLKNTLHLSKEITTNIGYERAKSLNRRMNEAFIEDHVAYSGSVEYLPESPLRATANIEYGENNTSIKRGFGTGIVYGLQKNFSFIAKYRTTQEDAISSAAYQTTQHLITGIAYRPVAVNWLNVLGKYEYKRDDNRFLNPYEDYSASIMSMHVFMEPLCKFELSTKFAWKLATERAPLLDLSTQTFFYLIRPAYSITEDLDIAFEYRLLTQKTVQDLLDGYNAEVGYVMAKNLRLSVGYNFKGYRERDLVDCTLWSSGPYVQLDFKFTEEILKLWNSK